MAWLKIPAVLALAWMVSGCALVFDGTTEEVNVTTSPEGAACDLMREGEVISTIASTPGTATVTRDKHDMTISCSLAGYQDESRQIESDVNGTTVVNVVIGLFSLGAGLIGWGIDSASGADNDYADSVHVTLQPKVSELPEPAASDDQGEPTS